MRTLLISEFFPGDPKTAVFGVHQRMSMLIDAAKALGELDILLYAPEDFDMSPVSIARWQRRLSEHWGADLTLLPCPRLDHPEKLPPYKIVALAVRSIRDGAFSFYPQKLSIQTSGNVQVRAFENSLERRPDVIIAHRLGAMAPLARSRTPRPPVVFDLDDIQHVKYRRMVEQERSLGSWLRYIVTSPLLRRAEKRAFGLAKTTFVCSERDRAFLEQTMGATGIAVIPNGVTLSPPSQQPVEPTVLFLGTYEYRPNVDAAVRLVREIWPLIRKKMPESRLVLAGAHPDRIPRTGSSQDGVEYPGFVEDLDGLYARTWVVACPIRVGSGTRIKILEACAYGRPVVSTTAAAEGIGLTPEQEIIVEDNPREFARACLELLGDPVRCRLIGEQARARVGALYDRATIVGEIKGDILSSTSGAKQVTPSAAPEAEARRRFVFVGGTTEPGGLHAHTAEVACGLAFAGHAVTILSTSHDFFSSLVSGSNVKVVRCGLQEDGSALRLFHAWWKVLAPFRGAQGVFCRSSGGRGSLAVLLAMWGRFSSLYTIEHSLPEYHETLDFRRPMWRDALAVRLVHRAVAVSESVRQAMIETFHFPPERIKTCVNWVDTDCFAPDPANRAATRTELGVADDCFVIGYVGRLGPEKRIDLLVRQFDRFQKLYSGKSRLVIVGRGWKEAELRALVESLGLTEQVTFAGWAEDVARWYCAFDLFVLPSLYEGFPLTLLEAMACEVPCLSHRIGGEIGGPAMCIRHGENGFLISVDDADVGLDRWLAKIAHLDETERRRIGQAARQTIVKDFSVVRRLPDLLEQLDAEDAAAALRSRGKAQTGQTRRFPDRGR